jgi:hypothetical protein
MRGSRGASQAATCHDATGMTKRIGVALMGMPGSDEALLRLGAQA